MVQSSFQLHRPAAESVHQKLLELVKTALIEIFVAPYATVCDLYCGKVPDEERWDEAHIGHYIGIDVAASGVSEVREAWESLRKSYTSQFFELDPCADDIDMHLLDKDKNQADVVCCMHHLQVCFETEDKAKQLLHNVSSLLKPGGYFFGITPDSSTIWAKYQKNVEPYHNKGKTNIPNCIRSESYMITFEVEEEKFPFFGKKYLLQYANEVYVESHCLVHFPSLIRLAREAGLEYVEIQNLTDFYDDNRVQLAGMLQDSSDLVDAKGRLLSRSYDLLGLYTTFIFQKPDPDITPPLRTPMLQDSYQNLDEGEWLGPAWRDDEKNGPTESSKGLGKITEQKGILGPGPAELRFPEAL